MEKFSLKWSDFRSNVSKSFGLLRSEEHLHDVRLLTEDCHEVSAHRLVLSASSEFFKTIFTKSKSSDTLICLDGVTGDDLTNILDYIYLGEAHIYEDKLERFLSIAKRLKLEGLLETDEEIKFAEHLPEQLIGDEKRRVYSPQEIHAKEDSAPKRLQRYSEMMHRLT